MNADADMRHLTGAGLADRFGTIHHTSNPAAVSAFGDAVAAVAAHRPDSVAAIDRALVADPDLVAAHALRAFGGVILARAETVIASRQARDDACAAAARRGGISPDEAVLLAALDQAIVGRLRAAAAILEARLQHQPHALLLIKLACGLRFMAGDPSGMRRLTTSVLPTWTPDLAGYGFLLGCHAFALEETGDLDAAERVGLEAVEREPRDAWGMHAVAHVFETEGRAAAGIAWIERTRPLWAGCNNFAFHLAWHLALFHLRLGRHAKVLDLYDGEIRAVRTEDFRDVANAVSLLWRLRQNGVDVGDRWRELAEIARRRGQDTTLIFATLHHLLALAATGDMGAASGVLRAIERQAAAGSGDQAGVAATVGVKLARAVLEGRPGPACTELCVLGGSNVQRDVFMPLLRGP